MKRIALIQREADDALHGEARDALDPRWHGLLAACGLLGVPLVNDAELAVRQARALGCAGVILTGGGDAAAPGRRARTEAAALAWAAEGGLPVLGVCRGMQALALAFGGGLRPVSGHVGVRHRIEGALGGREVNSYHDFALDGVPEGFLVTAEAGGVIEGIAHSGRPVHGIMWHPEREAPVAAADVAFIKGIFA